MNFDFSDDQKQLRDQARKFLTEKCSPKAVRVVLDGKAPYDKELWKGLAAMGVLGDGLPRRRSAADRRQRRAKEEMAACHRFGRGDRYAGAVRGQGQSGA